MAVRGQSSHKNVDGLSPIPLNLVAVNERDLRVDARAVCAGGYDVPSMYSSSDVIRLLPLLPVVRPLHARPLFLDAAIATPKWDHGYTYNYVIYSLNNCSH